MYGYKETGIHPSLGLVTTKEDECQHVTGTSLCLPFSFPFPFPFSFSFSFSFSFFSLFLLFLDKLGELVVGEVGSGYAAVLYHDVVGNTSQTEAGEEGTLYHLAVADNITG